MVKKTSPAHGNLLSALDLAPEVSLLQCQAFGRWRYEASRRRQALSGLRDQLRRALCAPRRFWQSAGLRTRPTLLIVDDNKSVRAITIGLLERIGCTVILDSIGSIRQVPVNAVLFDVPVLTEQHLATIQHMRRVCPCILVSTPIPNGHARDRLRRAGASVFLRKPIVPMELISALRELLHESNAARAASH